MSFELHQQLRLDTLLIDENELRLILLMKNAEVPWVIYVPKRSHLTELHELEDQDYQRVLGEIKNISRHMKQEFNAHKMNIANLGNIVSQLHIHIICRFENDYAWPSPVWGKPFQSLDEDGQGKEWISKIRLCLN